MTRLELTRAWIEAAAELGIRVQAPYQHYFPDGTVLVAEAFVPDFGSPAGMLVIALEDAARVAALSGSGLAYSALGQSYDAYDSTLFRETLDDWGWFGSPAIRPNWYTGKPWS
ncbi:MAG: hypothetical protein QM784_28065 [Polyangiaceae bacterium]